MTDLSTLKLFATHPHPCSYLEGLEATTVFVDPQAEIDPELYTGLSQRGFRRSGAHLYRPQCQGCSACISCRIPVKSFVPNRSQRRCWQQNQDLTLHLAESIDTDEHYQLYCRYIDTRHQDGDMYPPSIDQYRNFLTSEWGVTRYLEFRLQNELIALSVCDQLQDGLSAVYTFYSPDHEWRSLGKFSVLSQIEKTHQLDLNYLYLGYWIKNCNKMNYKIQYRPLELYLNHRWMMLR
jgi:arginyl-tRNA--protein-N-Asp/Glu arginylyltransferase